MTGREFAWRVFANELLASSVEEKGSGEKAPSYVISPLGARMNRVLLVGRVTPSAGSAPEPRTGFIRAQFTDPTGALPLTAGAYQPDGQADLRELGGPTLSLVVGKPALFRAPDSLPVASVRAEAVRPLPPGEVRALSTEIATQTLDRLELVLRLRRTGPELSGSPRPSEPAPGWLHGARASIAHYPSLDPAPYYEAIRAVVVGLPPLPDVARSDAPMPAPVPATVLRSVRPRTVPPTRGRPAGSAGMEGRLLEILDELAEGSPDGYADMDELAERAARHGIEGDRMEELLNALAERGTIEEPLVGKFRRSEGPPPEAE